MAIDYVLCAAGAGTRTSEIALNLPKPLIKLGNRTLLERSLDSLDLFANDRLIIVYQDAHRLEALAKDRVRERFPDTEIIWISVSRLTRGQLETALLARGHLRPGKPVVVFNCDTYFRSRSLGTLTLSGEVDGIIPCSQETGDHWSFCRVAGDLRTVVEVQEKIRISQWCSVGYYYFRDSTQFLFIADEHLDNFPTGECYVAPLYNKLIAAGGRVVIDVVETFKPMGSMQQITKYWGVDLATMQAVNSNKVIVVDLDGTLAIDDVSLSYRDRKPHKELIKKLQAAAADGYSIIVHTARRMRTHRGDEAKVIADIGKDTLEWLERFEVPFSGVRFGKPYAENGFYVDDKAVRASEFIRLNFDEINAIMDAEKL